MRRFTGSTLQPAQTNLQGTLANARIEMRGMFIGMMHLLETINAMTQHMHLVTRLGLAGAALCLVTAFFFRAKEWPVLAMVFAIYSVVPFI